eukprot:147738_1
MIYSDLDVLFTNKTMNIMFSEFNVWKNRNKNDKFIMNKSSAEIAYILYVSPLDKLITQIMDNDIHGKRFIEYYRNNKDFIGDETGWHKDEIYQLQSQLFMNQCYSEQEFMDNMHYNMN